jgi:hypothetical protein
MISTLKLTKSAELQWLASDKDAQVAQNILAVLLTLTWPRTLLILKRLWVWLHLWGGCVRHGWRKLNGDSTSENEPLLEQRASARHQFAHQNDLLNQVPQCSRDLLGIFAISCPGYQRRGGDVALSLEVHDHYNDNFVLGIRGKRTRCYIFSQGWNR